MVIDQGQNVETQFWMLQSLQPTIRIRRRNSNKSGDQKNSWGISDQHSCSQSSSLSSISEKKIFHPLLCKFLCVKNGWQSQANSVVLIDNSVRETDLKGVRRRERNHNLYLSRSKYHEKQVERDAKASTINFHNRRYIFCYIKLVQMHPNTSQMFHVKHFTIFWNVHSHYACAESYETFWVGYVRGESLVDDYLVR